MYLAKNITVLFSDIFSLRFDNQAIRSYFKCLIASLPDCQSARLPESRLLKTLLNLFVFAWVAMSSIDVWAQYQPYYPGGVSMGAGHCPTARDRHSAEDLEEQCEEIEEDLEDLAEEINEGLEDDLSESFLGITGCPDSQAGESLSIDDFLSGKRTCCKPQEEPSSSIDTLFPFPLFASLFMPYALAAWSSWKWWWNKSCQLVINTL